jgi:hypothetical protein
MSPCMQSSLIVLLKQRNGTLSKIASLISDSDLLLTIFMHMLGGSRSNTRADDDAAANLLCLY